MKMIVSKHLKDFLKTLLSLSLGIFLVLTPAQSAAEALIVLEYNGAQSVGSPGNDSDNAFVQDYNHSVEHLVRPNETLSNIMNKYYRNSGLNRSFCLLRLLKPTQKLLLGKTQTILFAGRKLRLPSVNEIQSMILGQKTSSTSMSSGKVNDEIFFFGN